MLLPIIKIKKNGNQERYNGNRQCHETSLPQCQHLVFLFLKQDLMRHQGRVLLITQSQIRRTHPYTLIANRVVQAVIFLQIIVCPLIITGFFVKLLQIFITDMYHVRVYLRRSFTHRQQPPCLRKVFTLQSQLYFLRIDIIKRGSGTYLFKERLAQIQIFGSRIRFVPLKKTVAQVQVTQIKPPAHIRIIFHKLHHLPEVTDCRSVIPPVVIRVSAIIQIKMLFIRKHLIIVLSRKFRIVVTLLIVAQCHISLRQSIVDGKLSIRRHIQRITNQQCLPVPENTHIQPSQMIVGIGKVYQNVRNGLRFRSLQSPFISFLETNFRGIYIPFSRIDITLHIETFGLQIGQPVRERLSAGKILNLPNQKLRRIDIGSGQAGFQSDGKIVVPYQTVFRSLHSLQDLRPHPARSRCHRIDMSTEKRIEFPHFRHHATTAFTSTGARQYNPRP